MGMTPKPLLTTFPTPSELLSSNGSGSGVQAGGGIGKAGVGAGAVQAKMEVDNLKTMETTQRKQRLRLLSDTVGFMPTDSDTISSHDKKRNYLECLEIYIGYLEDQMKIVKLQSPAIAKIMKVDIGMNNRSLRTLLVFMQKKLRELHQEVLKEEEKFLNLTKEVIALEQDNIRNGRDRSIACTKLLPTE
ncbi:uncharacterized protein STEHIDRAFT_144208 [Stereum hirsutum FP-91666 SS1]|uniref:uncharacterized protein n=1 Tax=Stereum hirsutum (strain FP-91666) TaxID=721885 RepID=UPI000440EE2D|nr:uncharacterized protein STEHIDRAFT_144208 [Stereum hirsutum FP-91666 SS1]EIM92973.1 hypothetical protein STEHIDRAFT_144208 [Stereum hirsutum FP-91666 SS1]